MVEGDDLLDDEVIEDEEEFAGSFDGTDTGFDDPEVADSIDEEDSIDMVGGEDDLGEDNFDEPSLDGGVSANDESDDGIGFAGDESDDDSFDDFDLGGSQDDVSEDDAQDQIDAMQGEDLDDEDIVVCPQDVKECSDGSFVSRDPFNNCEFGLCADEFEGAPEGEDDQFEGGLDENDDTVNDGEFEGGLDENDDSNDTSDTDSEDYDPEDPINLPGGSDDDDGEFQGSQGEGDSDDEFQGAEVPDLSTPTSEFQGSQGEGDLDDDDEFQGADGDDLSTPTSEFQGAQGEGDSDDELDGAPGDLLDGTDFDDDEPANMFDEDGGGIEGGLDENEDTEGDDFTGPGEGLEDDNENSDESEDGDFEGGLDETDEDFEGGLDENEEESEEESDGPMDMVIDVAGYETADDSDGFAGALGDDEDLDDSFAGASSDDDDVIDESATSDDVIDAFAPGDMPGDGIDFDLGTNVEDAEADSTDSDDDGFSGAAGDVEATPTSELQGLINDGASGGDSTFSGAISDDINETSDDDYDASIFGDDDISEVIDTDITYSTPSSIFSGASGGDFTTPTSEFSGAEGEGGEDDPFAEDDANMGDIEDATPTSEFSGAEGEDGEDDEYNADDNMIPPMDWLNPTTSYATPTSEFSGAEGEGDLTTPTSEFSGAEGTTPTSEFSGAEGEDEEDEEDDSNALPPMDWLDTDNNYNTPTSEFSGAEGEGDLTTPTSEFSGAEGDDGNDVNYNTPTSEIDGADGDELNCPEDAKECPDGTVVVRDPNNNCEFPDCPPYTPTSDEIEGGLDENLDGDDIGDDGSFDENDTGLADDDVMAGAPEPTPTSEFSGAEGLETPESDVDNLDEFAPEDDSLVDAPTTPSPEDIGMVGDEEGTY